MNVLEESEYPRSHEWVKMMDENTVLVGLSDYAQDALGDLVFVNLLEVGDEVTAGEALVNVEFVKVVSGVYSPVIGTVEEVNEVLLGVSESVNESPYDAWLAKIGSVTDTKELMSVAEYEAYVKTLG